MQTSCPVCDGLPLCGRSLPARALRAQYQVCPSCTLIWDGITAVLGTKFLKIVSCVEVIRKPVDDGGPLQVHIVHRGKFPSIDLQFYRTEGQSVPWPAIGVGSEVGLAGCSRDTVATAKQWLKACSICASDHTQCAPYSEHISPLPARLLDLGGHENEGPISLHISSEGEVGKYVALSHCWGGANSSTWTTTNENIQSHIVDIPQPLPQTFQDAVQVTRALGVRYLWIDSFCIIQDSFEDWHSQAPQMASVYGNSYVTISADAAEDSTAGFLEGSTRSLNTPHKINFEFCGQTGTLFVRERCSAIYRLPFHDWIRLRDDPRITSQQRDACAEYLKSEYRIDRALHSPLSKRAWVFQERVLSPRTLHFGHAEVGWECRSLVDCECTPVKFSHRMFGRPSLKDARNSMRWTQVLTLYTSMGMTYTNDRLVALSGLASARQQITQDSYVAGLWFSNIKNELMWYTDVSASNKHRLDLAPTWSWASTTAQVFFESWEVSDGEMPWNVVSWAYNHGSANPFAARVHITLAIEGYLTHVSIDKSYEARDGSRSGPSRYHVYPSADMLSLMCLRRAIPYSIAWDVEDHKATEYVVFVVAFSHSELQGLVLTPRADGSGYERLGLLRANMREPQFRSPEDVEVVLDAWRHNLVRQVFKLL